jgi:hypothetical protein
MRLSCNHAGYDNLWQGRAGGPPEAAGWPLRAEIDAVVARAYGLTREQYHHLLGTFSHKSYPEAPALCLAAFDRKIVQGNRAKALAER